MIVTAGKTNVSVYFYIVQDASATSPGEPVTGLLFSDIETGGSASYARQGAARVDLTLITLASASAAHADGGFILVDDTNMPGVYRCDFPDLAFATGVDEVSLALVIASANNAVAAPLKVQILAVDLRDAVRGGMTALPNAAADAAGGLPLSDAGGLDLDSRLDADVSSRLAPTVAARTLDITAAGNAGIDWANVENPTTVLDLAGTDIQLVDTTTTNTDMRGTDSAALASVLGALADAAAAGDPTSADTIMQYLKQLINTLEGTVGIPTYPASVDPANNVSLAEAIRAISDDVTGVAGSAMRGTDSALLAASAPTNFGDLAITVTTGRVDVGNWLGSAVNALIAGRVDSNTQAMGANVMTAAAAAADLGEEFADVLLGRNIAGGSNGGRDVTSALRAVRNRVDIVGGTMTVYQENDSTAAWTAAVSTAAGDPITQIDPA